MKRPFPGSLYVVAPGFVWPNPFLRQQDLVEQTPPFRPISMEFGFVSKAFRKKCYFMTRSPCIGDAGLRSQNAKARSLHEPNPLNQPQRRFHGSSFPWKPEGVSCHWLGVPQERYHRLAEFNEFQQWITTTKGSQHCGGCPLQQTDPNIIMNPSSPNLTINPSQ